MEREQKILFFIVALGGILRLFNLESVPHWYWDEGVNMSISWYLLHGQLQWFCLKYAFVPHPPLFFAVTGALLGLFGNTLLVLRSLCAFYGISSILLVYLLGKKLLDEKKALLSAFLFAIYPSAIYWNRLGFANNQVMFLSLLSFYLILLFIEKKERRLMYLAGVACGLASITDLLGLGAFMTSFIVLWTYDRRSIPGFLIVFSILPLIFVASMLYLSPEVFIADLTHNSGRGNLGVLVGLLLCIGFMLYPSKPRQKLTDAIKWVYSPLVETLKENALLAYLFLSGILLWVFQPSDAIFASTMDYFWMGVIGFFLMPKRERNLMLSLFVPVFLILAWVNRTDHMVIPLYPLFCMGFSVFLSWLYEGLKGRVPLLVALILVFHPVPVALYHDYYAFIDPVTLLVEDVETDLAVAEYVNNISEPGDLAITNSHMTRLIDCKTSVLIQCASFEGIPVFYMRGDYPPQRFVFNCSCGAARFFVLKEKDIQWALDDPGVYPLIADPISWKNLSMGEYVIYEKAQISE